MNINRIEAHLRVNGGSASIYLTCDRKHPRPLWEGLNRVPGAIVLSHVHQSCLSHTILLYMCTSSLHAPHIFGQEPSYLIAHVHPFHCVAHLFQMFRCVCAEARDGPFALGMNDESNGDYSETETTLQTLHVYNSLHFCTLQL